MTAATILLAALAIALCVAVATDLRSRLIHNELTGAVALAAPLYWWASGMALWPDVAIQLGLALAVFAAFFILFELGQMGGGDVKLLAALALWLPPQGFASLLVVAIPVGWVLTMMLGTWHVARADMPSRIRNSFVLGLCTLAAASLVSGMVGGPQLALPAAWMGESPFVALGVLLASMIAVTVIAYAIMRPHRASIRTPYGVAIAAGGLAVIAGGVLAPAAV